MTFKRKLIIFTVCLIVLFFAKSAFALVMPKEYYDTIAWTWLYKAPATTSYNCLGYATGSMVWEWPWGATNPSDSQVTDYLKTKYGYYKSNYLPKIISYGTYTEITHFAKVNDSVSTIAKWGSLERMWSGSWDPYYTNSYGHPVSKYTN